MTHTPRINFTRLTPHAKPPTQQQQPQDDALTDLLTS